MSFQISSDLLVFTDGACSGNPGPGGWGAVLAWPDGQVVELGGAAQGTTNNKMELMAAIQAIEFIKNESQKQSFERVYLCTDSVYVIRGITQWIWGWRKRDWKTAEGQEVSNKELWIRLQACVAGIKIHWQYTRGHQGIAGNERVDEIAVLFSKNSNPRLYRGGLIGYQYPIHDLPEPEPLPEMKSNIEDKKKPVSYLSYVNGKVERHLTWSSCEAAVKGRSGARFKKAMSRDDEVEILKSWGVDPKSVLS